MPTRTIRVCPIAELAEGGCIRAASGARAALVSVVDGEPFAVDDACLHRAGRLSEGVVRDGVVTCPQHWWRYDLRTGARVDHRDDALETYPVRVVDGWVEVDLPDVVARPSLREVLLAHARAQDP